MSTKKPALVFISGFLGSGKTTLMLAAARLLTEEGIRTAVITNDQSLGLVDTELARENGFEAAEVAGGCFCCRFSDLLEKAGALARHDPEVIFAEPVGSCTDIAATVLQPLKQFYAGQFQLAPLTVLVDPGKASAVRSADANSPVSFLFRNQLAEADLVCLNKTDLVIETPLLPGGIDLFLSAKTGAGVREWLSLVLGKSDTAGEKLLEIDYEVYAAAEAALGWLNWQGDLAFAEPRSTAMVVGPLLEAIDGSLSSAGIAIEHLKVLDRAGGEALKASICRNGEEPSIIGVLSGSPVREHQLFLNLRALGDPEDLRRIVGDAISALSASVVVTLFDAFRPSPPKPQHRCSQVRTA